MIRLRVQTDHDSAKVWVVTPLMMDCDWPIQFLVKMDYVEEWGDEAVQQHGKYHMTLHAVSPEACKDQWESCCRSMDYPLDEFKGFPIPIQSELLMDYGLSAPIWQKSGNNQFKLLKMVRDEIKQCQVFVGFKLDRQLNRCGNTGWDFLQGNFGFNNPVNDEENEEVNSKGQSV